MVKVGIASLYQGDEEAWSHRGSQSVRTYLSRSRIADGGDWPPRNGVSRWTLAPQRRDQFVAATGR